MKSILNALFNNADLNLSLNSILQHKISYFTLSFWVLCMMMGRLWLLVLGSLYVVESEGYPFADKAWNVASLQQLSEE